MRPERILWSMDVKPGNQKRRFSLPGGKIRMDFAATGPGPMQIKRVYVVNPRRKGTTPLSAR
jgi:hypothetical protein